jgi:ABC-type transporter Mla subunit MlaD
MNELDHQKQQQAIDRRMGYFIIAVIATIGCVVLCLAIYRLKNPKEVKIVSFEQTGNLKIEDPAYLIGILIGTVQSIELRKQNPLVFIRMNRPLKLHQGYHIDNTEIGFMGDRMLAIDFGDTTKPLIPDGDTLRGTFHPGLSEMIGMAWKLQGIVDSFINVSAKLLYNGPMHTSFVQRVNEIAAATDSAGLALSTVVTNLENGLSGRLDTLNRIIGDILRFSQTADSLTQQKISGVENLVGLLGNGLEKLEPMIDKLMVTIDKLDSLATPASRGGASSFLVKIKVLRDAVLHLKEGLNQLGKITIKPS